MMLNNVQKQKWILLNCKPTILSNVAGNDDLFNPRKEGRRTGTNSEHFYLSLQIPKYAMELVSNIK